MVMTLACTPTTNKIANNQILKAKGPSYQKNITTNCA